MGSGASHETAPAVEAEKLDFETAKAAVLARHENEEDKKIAEEKINAAWPKEGDNYLEITKEDFESKYAETYKAHYDLQKEVEPAETPAEGEAVETPAEGEAAETPAEGEAAEKLAEAEAEAETPAEAEAAEKPAEAEAEAAAPADAEKNAEDCAKEE